MLPCSTGLVRPQGRFLNIRMGSTGKVLSARSLRKSGICMLQQVEALFPPSDVVINVGRYIPQLILCYHMGLYPDNLGCTENSVSRKAIAEHCWGIWKDESKIGLPAKISKPVHHIMVWYTQHDICKDWDEEWIMDADKFLNQLAQPESIPISNMGPGKWRLL